MILLLVACSLERDPVPPEPWCHEASGTVEVVAVNPVEGSPDQKEVEYTIVGPQGQILGGILTKRYTAPLKSFKEAADLGACPDE